MTVDTGGEDRDRAADLAHIGSPIARRRPERGSSRYSGVLQIAGVGADKMLSTSREQFISAKFGPIATNQGEMP
jgi:hypothetical protein